MENRKIEYYGAEWSTSCKFVKPLVEALPGNVEIIDIEEQMERAMALGLRNIPVVRLLIDGVEIKRLVGKKSKQEIEELLRLGI